MEDMEKYLRRLEDDMVRRFIDAFVTDIKAKEQLFMALDIFARHNIRASEAMTIVQEIAMLQGNMEIPRVTIPGIN